MDLSRRFFLGGAMALIGVKTFVPSSASNMPRIYADYKHNDSYGFQALLNNEPCIFDRENIGVEENKGIIIYRGHYIVDETIIIPAGANISMERQVPRRDIEFYGVNLKNNAPFFHKKIGADVNFDNSIILFEARENGNNKLIAQDKWSAEKELEYAGLANRNYKIASEKEVMSADLKSQFVLTERLEKVGA